MDKGTPPHVITEPKDRLFPPKKVKHGSRSRLSSRSISPKWPWNKSSPTTATSDSTLTNTGDKSPDWKFMRRDVTLSKTNIKPSNMTPVTPDIPDRVSPKVGFPRKSIDSLPSMHEATPDHEEREPSVTHDSYLDTIAISDVAMTVAIDCSGSTKGKALEEEKSAIRSISKLLTQEAQNRLVILPWNHAAESALSLQEMDELWSTGGTDPTALLRDKHHCQTLMDSSLWVLLTDGEIDDWLVRDFATSIGKAGLHGTASIIICVGNATGVPASCNISVGKSVFAIVPDCMFLFHDIYTKKVYLLQCKGRFKTLIPDSQKTIVLDDSIQWEDLPQIPYEALRNFAIPRKRNLSPDTVVLTSGHTFNLNDVYNDTLDVSLTNEILSNDDDLKTLLLTALTRGRREDVERWISTKKLHTADPTLAPRKDIEHRAFRSLEKLVDDLRNSTMMNVFDLKKELCLAHETNWRNFTATIFTEQRQAKMRENVIADATARLRLDDRARKCATMMSEVSPSLRFYSSNPSSHRFSSVSGQYSNREYGHPVTYNSSAQRYHRPPSPPPPSPDVLFSQGYRCQKRSDHSTSPSCDYLEGLCTMCTRSSQVMALILKKPEEDEPTPNYPALQQHAKHKYPFVLGNFPDVDIVSSEIYCETCSVYLVRHGQTPKADSILGALPLVQTHGSKYKANLQLWIDTLMVAFGGRFHEDIVGSVFLSVLYNTLDDLSTVDSGENTHVTRAIGWACRNLLRSLVVSHDTTSIPFGELPPRNNNSSSSVTLSATLTETIPKLLQDALSGYAPLLSYPLDGFLVLILAARDIDNEICARESLRCFVWLRFAMHMAEAHYASVGNSDPEKAKDRLMQILYTQDPEVSREDSNQTSSVRKSPITVASLEGTHLLSSDDLGTFQRMGILFSHIGSKCGSAIAVYLHYLLEYSPMCSGAVECFEQIRKEKKLRKLFIVPEEVNPGQAADLIARLHASRTWF